MNRLLTIFGGLIAVAAIVITGLWYANRDTVEAEMVRALDQLDRGGVSSTYDAIAIEGFPFSYRGVIANLTLANTASGAEIRLPTVSAETGLGDIGAVSFAFPPDFEVEDAAGAVFDVAAEALALRVAPTAADGAEGAGMQAFDLALTADTLRVSPRAPETGTASFAAFSDLEVDGDMLFNPSTSEARIDFDAAVSAFDTLFPMRTFVNQPDGSVGLSERFEASVKGAATAVDIAGDLSGVTANMTFSEGSFSASGVPSTATVDVDPLGNAQPVMGEGAIEMTFTDLSYSVTGTPRDQFNFEELAAIVAGDDPGAFFRALGAAITRGDRFELTSATGSAIGGFDVEAEGDRVDTTFTIVGGETRSLLGPDALVIEGGAEGYEFAMEGVTAGETISSSFTLAELDINATLAAADAFDFSEALATTDPDAAAEAVFFEIGRQIRSGGKAAVRYGAGSGDFSFTMPAEAQLPFRTLSGEGGAGLLAFEITGERTSFEISGDAARYDVSGGLVEGGLGISRISFTGAMPLRGAPSPQPAPVALIIEQVDLDETLWELAEPTGSLPREINEIAVEAEVEVQVFADLLDEANFAGGAPPVAPAAVSINRLTLDLFGAQANGSGAVDFSTGFPEGSGEVRLRNWRDLVANISQTQYGAMPEVQIGVLTATSFLEQYGVPGADAAETVMEGVYSLNGGLVINGQAVTPPGGAGAFPAPPPDVEVAPDQNGEEEAAPAQ